MTDPILFDALTPRYRLPLLHIGQSQKEAFVNEALALADGLLHCSVAGVADAPPPDPVDGENWLIASGATGEWEGRDHALALRQSGNWIYVIPREGLRIRDQAAGLERFFDGIWRKAEACAEPDGGTVVDVQARTAIAEVITALRVLGIIPSS